MGDCRVTTNDKLNNCKPKSNAINNPTVEPQVHWTLLIFIKNSINIRHIQQGRLVERISDLLVGKLETKPWIAKIYTGLMTEMGGG